MIRRPANLSLTIFSIASFFTFRKNSKVAFHLWGPYRTMHITLSPQLACEPPLSHTCTSIYRIIRTVYCMWLSLSHLQHLLICMAVCRLTHHISDHIHIPRHISRMRAPTLLHHIVSLWRTVLATQASFAVYCFIDEFTQ